VNRGAAAGKAVDGVGNDRSGVGALTSRGLEAATRAVVVPRRTLTGARKERKAAIVSVAQFDILGTLALAEIGDFAVSVALGDAIVCLSRTIILRVHLERCSTPADLEFIGLVSSLEALQGLKAVVGAEALVELLLGSALVDTGAIGRARVSPAARSVGVASGGGGAREAS
jgi:hypothetical protein